jgi:hypothetical protein
VGRHRRQQGAEVLAVVRHGRDREWRTVAGSPAPTESLRTMVVVAISLAIFLASVAAEAEALGGSETFVCIDGPSAAGGPPPPPPTGPLIVTRFFGINRANLSD